MTTEPVPVLYFGEPGPENTRATLDAALARATQLGIKTAVVATDSGRTARELRATFGPETTVLAVSNPTDLKLPVTHLHDYLPQFASYKQALLDRGLTTVRCAVSADVAKDLAKEGVEVLRVDWQEVADYCKADLGVLDRVGTGIRVAMSVTLAAYLAGKLNRGQEVVAVAGTGFGGGGADVAVVILPGTTWREWRILETIARPRVSPPSEN